MGVIARSTRRSFFLTAINISDTHVARGYQVGAVDFLLKPIVPDILLSKVAVFVDLGQKADQDHARWPMRSR